MYQKRCIVREAISDENMFFNGCKILQDSGGYIGMSARNCMHHLVSITMNNKRQKKKKATKNGIRTHHSLAVAITWAGGAVFLQALLVGSNLQRKVCCFTVINLSDTDFILWKLQTLETLVMSRNLLKESVPQILSFWAQHSTFCLHNHMDKMTF